MQSRRHLDAKGITLIELLVVLVLTGLVIGGIYRVFVAQTRAYTVQDQVVEVQQSIRSAMEILLRDLRMAGYDNDSLTSKISIANPIVVDPANGDQKVTVNYEYDDTHRHEVMYYLDNGNLVRQLTIWPDVGASTQTTDVILEHVQALNFTYGVDTNSDGSLDSWVSAGAIGMNKVVAVRVALTANPDQTNPDVKDWVSPRTLTSAVTLRNLCFKR
ncbi:MAG TPA: PilW family protein [Thermodesulfobacteriota bacterium]|jgi:type IV pilus assembly protein PilW|nr:PilW family protein [Thermodesulfobacteriota bacterium]